MRTRRRTLSCSYSKTGQCVCEREKATRKAILIKPIPLFGFFAFFVSVLHPTKAKPRYLRAPSTSLCCKRSTWHKSYGCQRETAVVWSFLTKMYNTIHIFETVKKYNKRRKNTHTHARHATTRTLEVCNRTPLELRGKKYKKTHFITMKHSHTRTPQAKQKKKNTIDNEPEPHQKTFSFANIAGKCKKNGTPCFIHPAAAPLRTHTHTYLDQKGPKLKTQSKGNLTLKDKATINIHTHTRAA